MLYPKNVPILERFLRIAAGVALVAFAVLSAQSPLVVGVVLFTAVFMAVTGFVGWCPACALIGRKLHKANPQQ